MIYLLGEQKFKGVENLVLSEIKFRDFSVDLRDFDALLITSKNALFALKNSQKNSQSVINFGIALYAVGAESAKLAKKMGFENIKTPPKAYGKDLVAAFKDELRGKKCLYLRAAKIASNLDEMLLNVGVNLRQIVAYENAPKPPPQGFVLKRPAVFIFTAPSSVRNFLAYFKFSQNDKIIAIGQSTAGALGEILRREFGDEKELKSENSSKVSVENLDLKNALNIECDTQNLQKNSLKNPQNLLNSTHFSSNSAQLSPNLTRTSPQIFIPQKPSIRACVELARELTQS